MRTKWIFVLALATLVMAPSVANAGLIGVTVNVDFYFPNQSTLFCTNGTAVVGAGVEYPSSCDGFAPTAIDIADSQLTITATSLL